MSISILPPPGTEQDKKCFAADVFACHLLMPQDKFYEIYSTGLKPLYIAEIFQVPVKAVDLYIKVLGLK